MELAHFYHVYALGQWEHVVDHHIRALKRSPVGAIPTYVGVVGDAGPVLRRLADNDIHANLVANSDEGWEQLTLNALYEWSVAREGRESYVLYTHTKGAGCDYPLQATWRNEMEYWNVVNADKALEVLDSGASTAGVHYVSGLPGQDPYFGGNYWWARSSCLSVIGPPEMNTRYDAEVWIGRVTRLVPGSFAVDLSHTPIGHGAPEV
jgi:hypothetical protein